MKKLNKVVAFR